MNKVLLIIYLTFEVLNVNAQKVNWQNLDLKKDGFLGISTDKAYNELLWDKKPTEVIVAVIDAGIDTLHEDLKAKLWTDAATGIHGWNYIGDEAGREDVTRLALQNAKKFAEYTYMQVPSALQSAYEAHWEMTATLDAKTANLKKFITDLVHIQQVLVGIIKNIGKDDPSLMDFEAYQPKNEGEEKVLKPFLKRMGLYPDWKSFKSAEITALLVKANYHLLHGLNRDNPEPGTARGDADVSPDKLGPFADPSWTPYHGTHVAGIIGADRGNNVGMKGIADHVKLMALKVNGNIRELRDEDLASAIRFAVDHGAKVINMSFGKPYTWNKKVVDEAVKYAMQHDVLIVHAAGNSSQDNDHVPNYPSPFYEHSKRAAKAWLEVGASDKRDDSTLVASFSNYGRRTVDVFAPGVDIYSTLPYYNQYGFDSGTSMATPVVAGLAALIWEYYPRLSAIQVKDIIMKSVVKINHNVIVNKEKVPFNELCVSGGIANAYKALQLAALYR